MSTVLRDGDYWTHAGLNEIERAAHRQLDTLKLLRRDEGADWVRKYSLIRAIQDAAVDRRSGFEHIMSKELTDRAGAPLAHSGFLVPWEVFNTRADIVGTTTAGGYLVETANVPAADALRPNMLVGRRGCTFIDASTGNVSLPKLTGVATATWLPAETSQVSETDETFGQTSFSPHSVSTYVEFSRLLQTQAGPSAAEFVVRRDLINVIARSLDAACIAGTGSNGQPHGIIGATNVQTFSGTTLSITSVMNAAVALGDALDASAGIIANRTTAGLLRTRPETTYSTRMLWEGSLIEGSLCRIPRGQQYRDGLRGADPGIVALPQCLRLGRGHRGDDQPVRCQQFQVGRRRYARDADGRRGFDVWFCLQLREHRHMSYYDDRWPSLAGRNPLQPLADYKQPTMPQKKIRALTSDFFVGAGVVACEGRTYTIDADIAAGLIAQKRAAYAL